MKAKIWGLWIFVLVLSLAACAPATQAPAADTEPAEGEAIAEPTSGGELVVGLDQEPPTMDPHASPSAITFYVTASTGESLLYLDSDRQLEPWLAESWEVNEDGTEFTFFLRDDVTFQDGTPFNAEAVKWNFDRIVDPDFQAGGSLSALTGYVETEIVDEYTAKVIFEEPFAPFLTYAAGGTLAMLSPSATEGAGDEVNLTPVMSGPYQITEYVAKDHVTIERWDGYNRTPPWAEEGEPAGYLDTIVWKFIPEAGTRVATLESGETQMATVIPAQDLPRLQESEEIEVVSEPWVGAPRIWLLNVTLPPTDDLRVRQALNYAIDREAIVNTLYRGTGTPAIAPLTAAMLDDPSLREYYPYDPEMAAQLLDEAGWSEMNDEGIRMKDGQPLAIVINSIDYGAGPFEIDQLVQGMLRQVGIDASLKAQARPPWYEDNYNCATNGPIMFLRSGDWDGLWVLFHSSTVGGNFNWSCIADPEIDALLEQGRAEGDPEIRRQIYLELEQKLMDMALSVPLVDELSVWAMHDNLDGLIFNGFTYPILANVSFADQ